MLLTEIRQEVPQVPLVDSDASIAEWNASITGNEHYEMTFHPPFSWRKTKVVYYDGPRIPTFVLNKLIQIKEVLPQAEIWIEYVEKQDPIAAAELDDDYVYIEAWEEPELERKIEASA